MDSLYIFNFFSSFYGLCFSPDNTKLYVSLPEPPFGISPALFQFDLSAGDSIAIINSKRIISENPVFALKRAPDGRVYGADVRANTLHIIINPNITGIGCQYIANGFLLLNGTQSYCGLPNLGVLSPSKKYTLTIDSALCSQPRILKAKNHFGQNYVWEDGSSGHTRTVNNAGVYWVRYQVPVNTPCKYEYYIDTFKVIFGFISKDVYTTIKDSGMCNADTISISATNFNGSGYVWHDGYMGVHRKVNQTGIYYLSYLIDSICEHHVDSFIISYPTPPYKVSFDADTLVCVMDTFSFQNTSAPYFNNFIWSFGDLDSSTLIIPQHTYTHPGSYQVILVGHIGEICPDTAYRIIIADPIFETRFIKDKDSICQGESIMFTHKMNTKTITDLHWQMSDGNDFSTFDNQIKHAYDHSGIMPLMLTAQFRACPQSSFTDTIYVSALPKVNLGIESQLCLHGIPIVLKNLQPPPKEAYYTLWNTGDTTETLKIVSPGIYSLTVKTEPLGCSATESIMVHKGCRTDIPNAFTPNGDGINDFFFPRRLFSNGVQAFHMQVLNRWGQLLFETRNIDGRGWNGRYNNLEQPAEVYVYTIEIEFENGFKEKYMGNVTLMR